MVKVGIFVTPFPECLNSFILLKHQTTAVIVVLLNNVFLIGLYKHN